MNKIIYAMLICILIKKKEQLLPKLKEGSVYLFTDKHIDT